MKRLFLIVFLFPILAFGQYSGGQPQVKKNSEATSGTNAAQTTSIAGVAGQSVHLFSVTARCSAGTSGLTVKDGVGGTVIWSTAATDVTTAAKTFSFPVALASTTSNGMDVVLATCGVANTGTLDVQASQF